MMCNVYFYTKDVLQTEDERHVGKFSWPNFTWQTQNKKKFYELLKEERKKMIDEKTSRINDMDFFSTCETPRFIDEYGELYSIGKLCCEIKKRKEKDCDRSFC